MSPQSRMYRRGTAPPRTVRVYLRPADGRVTTALGDKVRHLEQLLGAELVYAGPHLTYAEVRELAHGRRTVRILFDHETGLARADELCGTVIIERVTDGRWEDLNDVEITVRLYAWARELPVSRIDAP